MGVSNEFKRAGGASRRLNPSELILEIISDVTPPQVKASPIAKTLPVRAIDPRTVLISIGLMHLRSTISMS